jgi:hypothetical protein
MNNKSVLDYAAQVAIDAIDRNKYPETLPGDWVEAGVWSRKTLNGNVLTLIDADVPLKFIPVDLERRTKTFKVYTKRWSISLFNSVVGTKYAVS